MTVTMENSTKDIDKSVTTTDKEMGATGVQAPYGAEDGKDKDVVDDDSQFARERQLILLTALYKLYGEEWKESPDWVRVSDEIKSANIPNFVENVTPSKWQHIYLSFFRAGYQVGIGPCAQMHKVPAKLTHSQKRLWILAKTSADLSRTSEYLDAAFRKSYKGEYETLKSLHAGNSDIKSQQVADALEVKSESGEDKGDKEEYEDPEAAKVALELEQAVLNKEILGFNDVLAMNRYCIGAAEHAIKAFPRFVELLKQAALKQEQNDTVMVTIPDTPARSPSKLDMTPKNTLKTPPESISEKEVESAPLPTPPKSFSTPIAAVETEPADIVVNPLSALISGDSSREVTPEKTKTPNDTINQEFVETDVSPDKALVKANDQEKTGISEVHNTESTDATSDNCASELPEGSKAGNGEEPADSQPLTSVTNIDMVGGNEEGTQEKGKLRGESPRPLISKELLACQDTKLVKIVKQKVFKKFQPRVPYPKRKKKDDGSVEVNETIKPKPIEIDLSSSPEKEDKRTAAQKKEEPSASTSQAVAPAKDKVDTPQGIQAAETKGNEVETNVEEDSNKTVSSAIENKDVVETYPEKEKDDKQKEEVAGKEKGQGLVQGNKKKESGSSMRSTRTSSRLASPEPNDLQQQQNEEQKSSSPKKTALSRQTSSSQQQSNESPSHTPALRSRRGATPTKAVVDVVATDNLTAELGPRSSTPSKPSAPVAPVDAAAAVAIPTPATASTDDTEEETFETPRSTPESTEMGGKSSDVESPSKPLKPVKVYSVKPPSPLSQVDPGLLDEFNDEDEDAELVEIDSNVNKAKGLKGTSSPSKSLSLRGRTVSSENAMDAGVQIHEDSTPSKRVTRKVGLIEDAEDDGASNNEEGESKRLTRSSLKLHDAANEESTEAPQTESEKAASESSFGGKEKKPRTSKQLLRVKKLHDEKNRFYGEDTEETPDGKRLTRARARTSTSSTSVVEKRSKPPSVGDSEGLSESEPTPTRATRSRSSTTTNTPAPVEPATASSHISTAPSIDDEEQKNIRKNLLTLYDKIMTSEAATGIMKILQDDQAAISKWNADFAQIKKKIEHGKAALSILGFQFDLSVAIIDCVIRSPNSNPLQEAVESFAKLASTSIEELKAKPGDIPQPKNDNSDVESLESHDEQRSETSSSKQTPAGGGGGGRRKRKRSASETSEEVLPQESKRRVTRTSTSSTSAYSTPIIRKTKHPISPDIVSANRVRH